MEFSIKSGDLNQIKTACILVGLYESKQLDEAGTKLDKATGQALTRAVKSGDISGKPGSTLLLHIEKGIGAERVLLVGLGAEKSYGRKAFCTALSAAFKALKGTAVTDVIMSFDSKQSGDDLYWKLEQAAALAIDGAYRFDQLKSNGDSRNVGKAVGFHLPGKHDAARAKEALRRGEAIGEGMSLTKTLGNLPPNICTPTYLADTAKQLAKQFKFKVNILEKKDMEKLGMNTLLSVSKASYQPPKFIVLEHNGGKKGDKPVVLVGKGITFDTGGISLKPAAEMDEMKYDMGGAAAVLGAMKTVGLMKLPLNVVMLVPTCENMPGGNATRPGDIVKSMAGHTVEILNTDAEGRLILCDALTYAERFKPAAVVDAATLTGAMVIALGHITTGIFANKDALAQELVAAGNEKLDFAWHLPMFDEYNDLLKSNFADIPNISGGRAGGSITAACFLSRFTKQYDWAHLDIAGTAWKSGADKGATGRPVSLLSQFLFKRAGLK
ncbi:MAG: leucyl aminopeptidase [Betaproteobacteria bacterium]|nr:leucyl aminopeptidase [Betaproteobacteria bacterium]